MKRLAEIESPIRIEEDGRRCISLLGRGKLVASFKAKLAAAADRLQGQGVLERRGDFVYRAGQSVFPPRNRRELTNAGLRKIESIAPEELRAAILSVVAEHIGPEEAEIAASVARIFGIQNTRPVQEAVRDAVAQLAAAQAVEQRGGKLFIG